MPDEARPYRVIVTVAAGVALNHPWLHLDGILHHLAYQRVLGREYYDLPTKRVESLDGERLGRWAGAVKRTEGLPHASVSFFDPDNLASLQYYSRFETEAAPGKRKVTVGVGHYRNWMMRWVYQATRTVTFYGCGDVAAVRRLLEDLTHLGNDVRVGWGRIANLVVEDVDEDWSVLRAGVAQRPIPTRYCAEWEDAVPLAWRAPYWAPANVEPCVPPGARCTVLGRAARKRIHYEEHHGRPMATDLPGAR